MAQNRPNRGESAHKRRVSLEDSIGQGKLNVSGSMEKGYYYHVVNDKNGRVEALKNRGYDIVEHGQGVSMGDSSNKEAGTAVQSTADNKDGTKAILMRCPKEFKDEDDAFRQSKINESEKALFRQAESEKGRYGKIETE